MKASSRPRKSANLSDSIHQQLNRYALAASAVGAGVLCLTRAAEAKVVYTPANVKIVQNAGMVRFDLNHDGIADFGFINSFSSASSSRGGRLRAMELRRANKIWGVYSSQNILCAAALPKGVKVGPKGQFQAYRRVGLVMAASDFHYKYGPWLHLKEAYLDLKFVVKGKTHFGWARVKLSVANQSITATLTGYAYETIPGKAIVAGATKGPDDAEPTAALSSHAPEPATLGALAVGAPGLSIWRRKESAATALPAN